MNNYLTEKKDNVLKKEKCPKCDTPFKTGENCCLGCNFYICPWCGKENEYKKAPNLLRFLVTLIAFPFVIVGLVAVILVSPEVGFLFPWKWLDSRKCKHCGHRSVVKCVQK